MKRKLLFLSVLLCGFSNAQNDCSDLIISEYVEGWSNNKAIEIYNPTSSTIDLGGYIIARASNGTSIQGITVKYAVQLTGMLAPYSTHVGVVDLRNPNGSGQTAPVWDSLQVKADAFYSPDYNVNSTFYWNGNDAVLLLKGTLTSNPNQFLVDITPALSIVDIFGKVGEDPGAGWSTMAPYTSQFGTVVTADHSLIRKRTVMKGVTNDAIAQFNALAEYDSIPPVVVRLDENGDTLFGQSGSPILDGNWNSLGYHVCDCSPDASISKVNNETTFLLYPNPSTGVFHVLNSADFKNISLVDVTGKVVYNNLLDQGVNQFSLNLNPGIYFVRLENGKSFSKVQQLIIK
jgi:hypothetical protein